MKIFLTNKNWEDLQKKRKKVTESSSTGRKSTPDGNFYLHKWRESTGNDKYIKDYSFQFLIFIKDTHNTILWGFITCRRKMHNKNGTNDKRISEYSVVWSLHYNEVL